MAGRRIAAVKMFAMVSVVLLFPSLRSETQSNSSSRAKIVFASGKGEIFIMNSDGSSMKKLGAGKYPAGSPDGTKITFISGTDVAVMDADGSNVKKLTNGEGKHRDPRWSPDGKRIAFWAGRGGGIHIFVMNADGSDVKQLSSGGGTNGQPAWSPDGKKIAFTSSRDGHYEMYVMDADGANVKKLTSGSASDMSACPTWSPDGKKIAFFRAAVGKNQLWVMNADGSDQKAIVTKVTPDHDAPAWSPDGKWITFGTFGGGGDVYIVAPDGANLQNLTKSGARDEAPNWLPGMGSAGNPSDGPVK